MAESAEATEAVRACLDRARLIATTKPSEALGLVLAAVRLREGEVGVFKALDRARASQGLEPLRFGENLENLLKQEEKQENKKITGETADYQNDRIFIEEEGGEEILSASLGALELAKNRRETRRPRPAVAPYEIYKKNPQHTRTSKFDRQQRWRNSKNSLARVEPVNSIEFSFDFSSLSLTAPAGESLLSLDGRDSILAAAYEDAENAICPKCSGLVARQRFQAHLDFWCSEAPEAAD